MIKNLFFYTARCAPECLFVWFIPKIATNNIFPHGTGHKKIISYIKNVSLLETDNNNLKEKNEENEKSRLDQEDEIIELRDRVEFLKNENSILKSENQSLEQKLKQQEKL